MHETLSEAFLAAGKDIQETKVAAGSRSRWGKHMFDQQDRLKSAIAEIERQARAFRREAAILVAVDVAFLVIVLVMVSVAVWWTIRDGS